MEPATWRKVRRDFWFEWASALGERDMSGLAGTGSFSPASNEYQHTRPTAPGKPIVGLQDSLSANELELAGKWLESHSAHATIERMLIPQFSLRWIMALTAACAVFSLILAAAVHGSPWAIALSVGVASIVVTVAVHGATFFGVWLFSLLLPGRRYAKAVLAESPFAATSRTAIEPIQGSNDGKLL
jgi:hypothetical protein